MMIDPDGDGPLGAREVACDVEFDGGGWTLIESFGPANTGVDGLFDGDGDLIDDSPLPGDASAALPELVVQALADGATQVHIRTPFGDDVDPETGADGIWITSGEAAVEVIENLRDLRIINAGLKDDGDEAHQFFTGPNAVLERLNYSSVGACLGFEDDESYPSVYWACGNPFGLHLKGDGYATRWNQNSAEPDAMEVWIR